MDWNVLTGALLTTGALIELLVGDVRSPVLLTAATVATLAIAARGRLPFLAPLTTLIALALPVVTIHRQVPALGDGPQSWSLALTWLIAAYTLGAHPDLRRAAAGLAACGALAGLYAAGPGAPAGSSANDVLAAVLFSVTVPWLAGLAMGRLRRARAADRLVEAGRAAAASLRSRLARDVHDLVAHSVSVMVVQAEAAEALLPSSPERTAEALRAVQETGRHALGELRRTVAALRAGEPAPPEHRLAALPALVGGARAANLPVTVVTDGDPIALPPDIDASAYRVVQEGVTNALRHSDRTGVLVRLGYTPGQVDVTVTDEGRPVHRQLPGGHGMTGLRELVTGLGGAFDAGPTADGHHVLHAAFPTPVTG